MAGAEPHAAIKIGRFGARFGVPLQDHRPVADRAGLDFRAAVGDHDTALVIAQAKAADHQAAGEVLTPNRRAGIHRIAPAAAAADGVEDLHVAALLRADALDGDAAAAAVAHGGALD